MCIDSITIFNFRKCYKHGIILPDKIIKKFKKISIFLSKFSIIQSIQFSQYLICRNKKYDTMGYLFEEISLEQNIIERIILFIRDLVKKY